MDVTCDVCGKEVGDRDQVNCSGVCGKMAHAECLTNHPLRQVDEWFCSTDCRNFDERYKQHVEKNRGGGAARFTVKIWRVILQNFDVIQLANARLVCRLWKRVIDRSPSLVDKLVLIFPRGSTLDKHCEMVKDLVTATLRYTRARLMKVTVVGAASWWPAIGGGLNSLVMTDCKISIEMLLDLLKVTPRLKRFALTFGKHFICRTIPRIDFQLQSLEELFLAGIQRVELLDVFGQLCPRLRVLRIPGKCKLDGYNEKLVSFVKKVRRTLEEMEINGENELFDKLTDLNGILLKRVILGNIGQEILIYMSQQCPMLESISVTRTKFTDEKLAQIGDNLPMLTSLAIKVAVNDSPSVTFLNCMPELEHLSLKCLALPISFGKVEYHRLTNLTLQYAKQTENWFQHFPDLQSVTLISCTIAGSWSNLFVPITQLRKLQRLKLDKVSAESVSDVEYLPDYLESLTALEIEQCELPKDSLQMLFQFCPRLVMIRLYAVKGVRDELGVAIAENGKYLREVQVHYCAIHNSVFLEHIRKHCRGVVIYLDNNLQEEEYVKSEADDELEDEMEDVVEEEGE